MKTKHFRHLFSRKNLRKLWLNIYLTLALAVGFVFVILGITGSCNIFYTELREWDLPAVTNSNQAQPSNLDYILKTVKAAHPQRTQCWTVLLPGYGADFLLVEYMKPEETRDELWAPLEILIDPYSGKIVEQALWGRTLPGVMYEIHADFYAGRIGKEIGEIGFDVVCFCGIFLFISCLSGLYLWWPRSRKFKQALTINPHASPERFYFDLHKTTGFYSAALLLILAFTGFAFSYEDYIKPVVNVFSTVKKDHLKDPVLKSTVVESLQPISIAQAVAIAEQVFLGAGITRHCDTGWQGRRLYDFEKTSG